MTRRGCDEKPKNQIKIYGGIWTNTGAFSCVGNCHLLSHCYLKGYEEDFDAVSTVQDIKVKLQEALKEMLLIVESTEPQDYTTRSQLIDQNIADIRASVDRLCSEYSGDTTLLKQFETLMTNNGKVRERVMEQAALSTDE